MRPITTQQVDVFNTVLYNFNWSPVFSTKDIDEKVDVFQLITDGLSGLINEYFPEKTVESYDKDKPFITQKIKSLMIKRDRALRRNDNGLFR